MIKIEKKLWDPQNASLVTENPIYWQSNEGYEKSQYNKHIYFILVKTRAVNYRNTAIRFLWTDIVIFFLRFSVVQHEKNKRVPLVGSNILTLVWLKLEAVLKKYIHREYIISFFAQWNFPWNSDKYSRVLHITTIV